VFMNLNQLGKAVHIYIYIIFFICICMCVCVCVCVCMYVFVYVYVYVYVYLCVCVFLYIYTQESEVLTTATVKRTVFCDVTTYSLVYIYLQTFQRTLLPLLSVSGGLKIIIHQLDYRDIRLL